MNIKTTNNIDDCIKNIILCNNNNFSVEFYSWFQYLKTCYKRSDIEYKFIEKTCLIFREKFQEINNCDLIKGEYKKPLKKG